MVSSADKSARKARLTVDLAREDYLKLCGVARLRGESLSTTVRTVLRRTIHRAEKTNSRDL